MKRAGSLHHMSSRRGSRRGTSASPEQTPKALATALATDLVTAIRAEQYEEVDDILSKLKPGVKGRDIRALDRIVKESQSTNLIHLAIEAGNIAIVTLLVKHSAPIKVTNAKGLYPIHAAVIQFDIFRALMDHKKIDLNVQDVIKSQTALMFSVSEMRTHVCKILIDKGCDVEKTDSSGKTALHM